jgi:hypothetical protein
MTEDEEVSELENVDIAPVEHVEEGEDIEVFIHLYLVNEYINMYEYIYLCV